MSYCRLCLFAALIGGMFVRTDAAVRAAEKSMTLSQPVNAHFNTLSTPTTTPAPLFADINNSYQTASICFIGFGECGDNTDFSKSDDGFSLPDCASIGYPLTSCTPPGYPDKFCPYDSSYFAACRENRPKACADAGYVTNCSKGEILDPDALCPHDGSYGNCICNPCSGYDYTYEEATEKATKSTASPATAAEP